jgi:hypothetical protein
MKTIIAPSVLAADFGVQRDIEMINNLRPIGFILILWMAFCAKHSWNASFCSNYETR